MTIYLRRWFTILVIGLSLLGSAIPAHASEAKVAETSSILLRDGLTKLVIEPLQAVELGSHPTITMHLTGQYGHPLPNQVIRIFINGARKAEAKTDTKGVASVVLRYKFVAGTYQIKAVYYGIFAAGVSAASAETELVVRSTELGIQVVPPIAGIGIKFNGQIYVSDQNGNVKIPMSQSGVYTLEVLPVDPKTLPPNTRIEFARWSDEVFTPVRKTYFPRTVPLKVGLIVSHQITPAFYDPAGNPIDPTRVSYIVIKRLGEVLTFKGAEPVWLPSNRIVHRMGGELESNEYVYFFSDVVMDGAHVVNKNQQRFHLIPGDVWPINLLVYTVRFSARDAMFHAPIGKGIELTYPDGHKQQFFFESHSNEIVIPTLARGSYSAKIIGAGGSAPSTPIHLSRDQDVELLMLSYLDIGLIVGVPLLIVLIFFFIGRPYWIHVLRHPSKYRELVYEHRERQRRMILKP